MATHLYLAMTAAEYWSAPSLPSRAAWMACHFCPYSLGLSNLPEELSPGSMLILSDIIPIHGHDPKVITRQLEDCIRKTNCTGILLDFQRYPCRETEILADTLIQALDCLTVVSAPFAAGKSCPVFLPPCPPHIPLQDHLAPWNGREIWLEVAYSPIQLLLSASGTTVSSLSESDQDGFSDESLHCHYRAQVAENYVRFQLWRTDEDLKLLMEEGSAMGIRGYAGLYQELTAFRCP